MQPAPDPGSPDPGSPVPGSPEESRPEESRPDRRLGRTRRLITQRDFRQVYNRGRRSGGRWITVVALPRGPQQKGREHPPLDAPLAPPLDPPLDSPLDHRLGLSVSKANGNAVRRNAIKRRLREAFRLTRAELPGSYDMVLIPKVRDGHWHLAELRQELLRLVTGIHENPQGARRKQRRGGTKPRGKRGKQS